MVSLHGSGASLYDSRLSLPCSSVSYYVLRGASMAQWMSLNFTSVKQCNVCISSVNLFISMVSLYGFTVSLNGSGMSLLGSSVNHHGSIAVLG